MVTSVGQIIGIVVAKNKDIAKRGAKLVKVNYTKLPTIITIEVSHWVQVVLLLLLLLLLS